MVFPRSHSSYPLECGQPNKTKNYFELTKNNNKITGV